MDNRRIKNFNELSTTRNRGLALEIAEAGLEAIDTEKVVFSSITLSGNILSVRGSHFDLEKFKKIKVVGFGKSSAKAATALEKILGSRITEGAVIGIEKAEYQYMDAFVGTHPRPTEANTEAGKKIYEMINGSREDDLIIVLVSGGGSALLSYPESECGQGIKLYDSFLKSGKTITEMNTVRKHLSLFKGGGLAQIAYPATIIGLIFSDVPGNAFEDVASGPTYKDETTTRDAERIIKENDLGEFELTETPKDDKYFEKVRNFVLVSNTTAIDGMAKKAKELGLEANILSTELYDEVSVVIKKIFSQRTNNSVVLAAGEPSLLMVDNAGKGGRDLQMSLQAIKLIKEDGMRDSVFIALASDGVDNSDAAGAIVDADTLVKGEESGLDIDSHLERFDSYNYLEKTGDMIMTGPTGANVSDLMILLSKE